MDVTWYASYNTRMMNYPNLEPQFQKPYKKGALLTGHSAANQSNLSHSLQDTIRDMTHAFLEFGYSL